MLEVDTSIFIIVEKTELSAYELHGVVGVSLLWSMRVFESVCRRCCSAVSVGSLCVVVVVVVVAIERVAVFAVDSCVSIMICLRHTSLV